MNGDGTARPLEDAEAPARRDAEALALIDLCLSLDEASRNAALDEAMARDPALAATARQMLARSGDAIAWMPTEAPGLWAGEIDALPERIGAFRVVGVLGEGGMGLVLRGERDDGLFEQTVAIKLIRGALPSVSLHERFVLERQILARLDSPAICRILDGGSWNGRPYIVMEYVDGLPLTEHARQAALDLEARLMLFRAAASAVREAHRKLIVHADLKPSNILVTADGTVKLLDFGIARLLEAEASGTAGHGVALTRAYAAPEIRRGEAPTVTSDVYGLGAVLRELLTGAPPADAAATAADCPVPARLLRGDLEAIVGRATASGVAARYPDAASLIADLDARATHQPVQARGGGRRYRFGKFLRRHRAGLAITAAILLVLSAATTWSVAQSIRAERARADAAARFADARGAARYLLFRLMDELERRPHSLALRSEVAGIAQHYLDRLSHAPGAPPEVRFEAASGLWKLARAQGVSGHPNLGDQNRASANLAQAAAIAATLHGAAANRLLAQIQLDRARTAMDLQFDLARSEAMLAGARAAILSVPGDTQDLRAQYWLNRGKLWGWEGKYPAAEAAARRVLAMLPAAAARDAAMRRIEATDELAEEVYYADGPAAAEPIYRAQIASLGALVARYPGNNYILMHRTRSRYDLAMTMLDLKRPDDALAMIDRTIADADTVLAFDPADYNAMRMKSLVTISHAQILSAAGRHGEGLAILRRLTEEEGAAWKARPDDVKVLRNYAFGMVVLGEALDGAARAHEACDADRRAVALYGVAARAGALTAFDQSNNLKLVQARIARNCGRAG